MNPLTNVKNITKLTELELNHGTSERASWHAMYKDSAWIFIGGLSYDLTEGDVITVFSEYGEVANVNLVRDRQTGKPKGYCFLCYINQKSTILAVDNLNGIKLCNRTIRVDHVANYKPPTEREEDDELTKQLHAEGCAPAPIKIEEHNADVEKPSKKVKKEKKKKKKKKKKHNSHSPESSSESDFENMKLNQEKVEVGYEKHGAKNTELQLDGRGPSKRDSSGHEHNFCSVVSSNKTLPRHDKESCGSDISNSDNQTHKRRCYVPDTENTMDRKKDWKYSKRN